jgi:hypothetical protein
MNLIRRSFLAFCFILSSFLTDAFADVSLQIDPLLAIGGVFSPINPDNTEITTGSTTIRVLSTAEDWKLFVTVLEPFRRISDGIELPMQRFHELFPDISDEILNFQPHMLRDKRASANWYELIQDWQPFQEAMQDYLLDTYPPGTYRSHLRFELFNNQNSLLTDAIDITIEFDLRASATVEMLNHDITLQVQFADSLGHGESYLVPIAVRSNTSWVLKLEGSENGAVGPSGQIPLEMISARVDVAPGDEWQGHLPYYEPLQASPMTIASGIAPLPFMITEATVPLQLSCDVPLSIISASYEAQVTLTIETTPEAR